MQPAEETERPRDISDFRLLTAACELRFANAYSLWDRAGSLWSAFVARHPDAKLVRAEPNQTAFRIGSEYEFTVTLDRLVISAHKPATIDAFGTLAYEFSRSVAAGLDIVSFSRVGFRPVFVREHPDTDAATKDFLSLNLIRVPVSPSFGISGQPRQPRFACRFEDGTKGCLLQIAVNTREYDPETPFAWEGVELSKIERHGVVLDVDYYTLAMATMGQLNLQEWIKQAMHVIRRDIGRFLGGVG